MSTDDSYMRQNGGVFSRILLVLSLFLFSSISMNAAYYFRVWLKDKQKTKGQLENQEAFLSTKSIERRNRLSIRVDSTDLPVSELYIRSLVEVGGKYVCQSRWANTVVMDGDCIEIIDLFRQMPFVDSVQCVKSPIHISKQLKRKERDEDIAKVPSRLFASSNYGAGWRQIDMLKGHLLHERGYSGKGITVAVIDGGFDGALNNPYLDTSKVVGSFNFVQPGATVFGEHYHGAAVLSIMASNGTGQMIGTAPNADYWLLNSEDVSSEYRIEEDYLAAAIEYADSIGVDLANISLGYSIFDDPTQDHSYEDYFNPGLFLNIVIKHAAEKGIMIVTSAGNERTNPWKKIVFPANSPDVLCVGAVDISSNPGYFTSEGWVIGQSVKPDVCAMGVGTSFVDSNGVLKQGNGTSFASPLICGLMACMIQAFPTVPPKRWIESIVQTGTLSLAPQSLIGYGLPDFDRLFEMMRPISINESAVDFHKKVNYLSLSQRLVWDSELDNRPLLCTLFDSSGRIIQSQLSLQLITISDLKKGVYYLVVQAEGDRLVEKIIRR